MDLQLLENQDLDDLTIPPGFYYVNNTCTGFPHGISAGRLIISSHTDTHGNVHFIKQELEGIINNGDRVLSKFERFVYPYSIHTIPNFETKWFRLDTTAYKLHQPQLSRSPARP